MTGYMAVSQTDNWATPQAFFDKLNAEFNFDLDVCADAQNAKCERYFTKEQDGLLQEWTGTVWCNPPYGRVLKDWLRKSVESWKAGATVVLLVPARTDTGWWHDYATQGEIRFIRGRLKFGDSKTAAPFPSAVIVFR
jgi:phage N-6-adenine-methyltransferase